MIIYEVNIELCSSIFDEYIIWLYKHVKEMLLFSGFTKAFILKECYNADTLESIKNCKIRVQYIINNIIYLEDYINNHAHNMRNNGLKKFNKKFTIIRKIFDIQEEIF